MVRPGFCNQFFGRPPNSYRPLVCKPVIFDTRTIGGQGAQNKRNYFFLMKPNTIRENATVDLLFPIQDFVRKTTAIKKLETSQRVTAVGDMRITTEGALRITLT